MSTTTRLLETGFETKFHALQIIFVRMLVTACVGSLYMWYKQVPGFPFGSQDVRGLLVLRGIAGSAGLFGLYCEASHAHEHALTKYSLYDLTPYTRLFVVSRDIRGYCYYIPRPDPNCLHLLGCP